MSVTALRVEPAGLEELRDQWRALHDELDDPFCSWEWAHAWSGHRPGRRLAIHAVREPSGELVAVLPLELAAVAGVRVARWIGHDAADRGGPACRPGDRARVGEAVRRAVPALADVLVGSRCHPDWAAPLGARTLGAEGLPIVELAGLGSWDAFLATRSSNFRSQLGKRERRLARAHDLVIRRSDDPAEFETLVALHEARWHSATSVFREHGASFHRAFARAAAERGWMRLWLLELDGRPVAAWYGWRTGRMTWAYQVGRDPAADGSVGLVLYAHALRGALEEGATACCLGRGRQHYKLRFAGAEQPMVDLAVSGGARGGAYVAAVRARRGLSDLRTALRTRSGRRAPPGADAGGDP